MSSLSLNDDCKNRQWYVLNQFAANKAEVENEWIGNSNVSSDGAILRFGKATFAPGCFFYLCSFPKILRLRMFVIKMSQLILK